AHSSPHPPLLSAPPCPPLSSPLLSSRPCPTLPCPALLLSVCWATAPLSEAEALVMPQLAHRCAIPHPPSLAHTHTQTHTHILTPYFIVNHGKKSTCKSSLSQRRWGWEGFSEVT